MPGRGNGLDAESYKPLTDLEPPDAETMLRALRAASIAAYVAPIIAPEGQRRPQDEGRVRLWVDATATLRARAVLRTGTSGSTAPSTARTARTSHPAPDTGGAEDEQPASGEEPPRPHPADDDTTEGGPMEQGGETAVVPPPPPPGDGDSAAVPAADTADDEDVVWQRLVAAFEHDDTDTGTDVVGAGRRWPSAEDLPGPRDTDQPASRADSARTPRSDGAGFRVVRPAAGEGGPRDWEPAELGEDDPDAHFVPPPPPPLPRANATTALAWVALIGGPLFLLVSVLVGRPVGAWTSFFAFVAFTGGFITLVARMRRDRDDDPDDGAVV